MIKDHANIPFQSQLTTITSSSSFTTNFQAHCITSSFTFAQSFANTFTHASYKHCVLCARVGFTRNLAFSFDKSYVTISFYFNIQLRAFDKHDECSARTHSFTHSLTHKSKEREMMANEYLPCGHPNCTRHTRIHADCNDTRGWLYRILLTLCHQKPSSVRQLVLIRNVASNYFVLCTNAKRMPPLLDILLHFSNPSWVDFKRKKS